MAQRKGTDVWSLPPVDAPDEPSKGMRFWVQTGDHWAIGDNHSVSRVSSRSFYIAHAGGRRRYALERWFHWLSERDAEGFVVLDGHPMRRPRRWVPPSPGMIPIPVSGNPKLPLGLQAM